LWWNVNKLEMKKGEEDNISRKKGNNEHTLDEIARHGVE
jgi:hypothetical protein